MAQPTKEKLFLEKWHKENSSELYDAKHYWLKLAALSTTKKQFRRLMEYNAPDKARPPRSLAIEYAKMYDELPRNFIHNGGQLFTDELILEIAGEAPHLGKYFAAQLLDLWSDKKTKSFQVPEDFLPMLYPTSNTFLPSDYLEWIWKENGIRDGLRFYYHFQKKKPGKVVMYLGDDEIGFRVFQLLAREKIGKIQPNGYRPGSIVISFDIPAKVWSGTKLERSNKDYFFLFPLELLQKTESYLKNSCNLSEGITFTT